MKEGIHPKMNKITASCACGESFDTLSTKNEIRVELCSKCHPFYTGKTKIVDTAGRVEKFMKRYARVTKLKEAEQAAKAEDGTPEAAAAGDEATAPKAQAKQAKQAKQAAATAE